jgi:hypothetical protein
MSMHANLPARLTAMLFLAGAVFGVAAPANAGVIYKLDATNISFTIPSPLFTDSSVTGFLVISNSVAPGGSFGVPQLENLSSMSQATNTPWQIFSQASMSMAASRPMATQFRFFKSGMT